MDLNELNRADAKLRQEHAAMVRALQRIRSIGSGEVARRIAVEALMTLDEPLVDGGGSFDRAVDKVIAHTDKRLEGVVGFAEKGTNAS